MSPEVQRLFEGHFIEGRSIFTPSDLVTLATEAGFDGEEVGDMLASDSWHDRVEADEREGHRVVTQGVPTIVIDGRHAVPGSQTTDGFLALFLRIREVVGQP